MNKDPIDVTLAIVQILALCALVVYVIQTWNMASATKKSAAAAEKTLQEMKEMRDQETAPYVIIYFETAPAPFIYLVVKNIGKSVAKDVKLDFIPRLESGTVTVRMNDIPMIQHGIASLAPGQELRTFFDSAITYFGREDLPLQIIVGVSYSGGLRAGRRSDQQTLDLGALKGLFYTGEKGFNELIREVEKIADGLSSSHSLQHIGYSVRKGIASYEKPQKRHGWRPKASRRI